MAAKNGTKKGLTFFGDYIYGRSKEFYRGHY